MGIYASGLIGNFDPNALNLDAFQRLRVSMPENLFDSKQLIDSQALVWDDQIVSGSGGASTYNANQASTTLSTTTNTAVQRVRQTFKRFNYQAGKSTLILMSGILGAPGVTGITRRVGQFDANNGYFFETNPNAGTAGVQVVIRTKTSGSVSDANAVTQANWNLDKFDGTGPSKITLDLSKVQIFAIAYEWLGVGSAWFGFVIGGKLYWAHRFDTSNSGTLVYTSTPNLPLRWEINALATSTGSSLTHICSAVMSEAGSHRTGMLRAVQRFPANLMATGNNINTIYPVVAMQLRSGYETCNVEDLSLSIHSITASANYIWMLCLNPTVAGTALSFSTVTNTEVQADVVSTNATTLSATGTILASGAGVAAAPVWTDLKSDLRFGSTIAGVNDILVLAIQNTVSAANSFIGSINFRSGLGG